MTEPSRPNNENKFSHDLNFYFNSDNIRDQHLVFDTYEYFENGDGIELCSALEFLNLLYWHYKFIDKNLNTPYDVITQVQKVPEEDGTRHVLLAFLLKWYGGYPVKELRPKYLSILRLLEKEYLKTLNLVVAEKQAELNKGLNGEEFDQLNFQEIEKSEALLYRLDRMVKILPAEKSTTPQPVRAPPESPIDPTVALNNTIRALNDQNRTLSNAVARHKAVAWFKNYGMWFALISGAFLLGGFFGFFKFDSEKIQLSEQVSSQKKTIDSLKTTNKKNNERL